MSYNPDVQELALKLINNDDSTWSEFFLNPSQVRVLDPVSPEDKSSVLACGARWEGSNWNTTKVARTLHELFGEALVSADFSVESGLLFFLSLS